jgi:hypothetical protein
MDYQNVKIADSSCVFFGCVLLLSPKRCFKVPKWAFSKSLFHKTMMLAWSGPIVFQNHPAYTYKINTLKLPRRVPPKQKKGKKMAQKRGTAKQFP